MPGIRKKTITGLNNSDLTSLVYLTGSCVVRLPTALTPASCHLRTAGAITHAMPAHKMSSTIYRKLPDEIYKHLLTMNRAE